MMLNIPRAGGGFGPVARYFGLGCDLVEEVELVMADGRILVASANSNSDLFWATCGGGGGNFGIAVSFTLGLLPVPKNWTFFAFTVATELAIPAMVHWQDWVNEADSRLTTSAYIKPEELQVYGWFVGSEAELRSELEVHGVLKHTEYSIKDLWVNSMGWYELLLHRESHIYQAITGLLMVFLCVSGYHFCSLLFLTDALWFLWRSMGQSLK
jgi:hypothetical protein